jgi:hypothetical protein
MSLGSSGTDVASGASAKGPARQDTSFRNIGWKRASSKYRCVALRFDTSWMRLESSIQSSTPVNLGREGLESTGHAASRKCFYKQERLRDIHPQ